MAFFMAELTKADSVSYKERKKVVVVVVVVVADVLEFLPNRS